MDIPGTLAIAGHSILLQQPSYTVDAVGGRVATWKTVGNARPAWVQDASSDIVLAYARRDIKVTHRIYVQTNPGVKEGWRILFGARYFLIVGVSDMAGLNELYAIDAVE